MAEPTRRGLQRCPACRGHQRGPAVSSVVFAGFLKVVSGSLYLNELDLNELDVALGCDAGISAIGSPAAR